MLEMSNMLLACPFDARVSANVRMISSDTFFSRASASVLSTEGPPLALDFLDRADARAEAGRAFLVDMGLKHESPHRTTESPHRLCLHKCSKMFLQTSTLF